MRLLVLTSLVAGLCALGGCDATSERPQREGAHPPVVFISFDEFTTTSLVGNHGRIDAVRYPNFAALARDGNWFPYATASSDETSRAMVTLLTGNLVTNRRFATYTDNPRNLFTLLGPSYRMHASEEVSSMCPRRLCPDVRPKSAHTVVRRLFDGRRAQRFKQWTASIRSTRRPTLFFEHVLLPHAPWRYLPSGRESTRREPVPDWAHAFGSRWVAQQKYQRQLLQLEYLDRLLGDAMRRLKDQGLYDRALIVVTADNGESFGRIGNGHEVSRRNFGDIALTPLILKRPFAHDGRVVRRHVRTVDVVPTVAAVAHMRPRWRMQGHSVYGSAARRIPGGVTVYQRNGHDFRLSNAGLHRWARSAERLKLRLFGAGKGPPGMYGIGPYRKLVGTPPSRWAPGPAGKVRTSLDQRGDLAAVRLASSYVPAYLTGRLRGPGAPPRAVALAVNGTIVATSPAFRVHRGGPLYFAALAPESAFHDGRNPVSAFGVSGPAGKPRLTSLGG